MCVVFTVTRKGRQCHFWAGMSRFKGPHIYPLPELFSLTLPVFFVVCIVNPPSGSWSKVLRYEESWRSRSVDHPTGDNHDRFGLRTLNGFPELPTVFAKIPLLVGGLG